MAYNTWIDWCEASWNPSRGCTRVSKGCERCYAERIAHEHSKGITAPYSGLTTEKGIWNGTIKFVPHILDMPKRWKKPRTIFVNSMSDLFHENLDGEHLKAIFDVMNEANHHIYYILTKRPIFARDISDTYGLEWGEHIWMGVSVENNYNEQRLRILRDIPAKHRFLSAEPLLEDISFLLEPHLKWLEWVIVGGESGTEYEHQKARPMQPIWAQKIGLACNRRNVPFFFKQMGGNKSKGKRRLYIPGTDQFFDREFPPEVVTFTTQRDQSKQEETNAETEPTQIQLQF